MPNEIQIAGPDKRVQDRCVYGEIGVRHSSVLSVPLLGDFGELSRTGVRGGFIVPMHGTRVVGAFPESGRGQPIHVGSDNLCPTPRFTLNARQKNTAYERTTIGNVLRTVNRPSPGDSTSAPHDPCAVVVYADATGRGSRVGLGAGTTGDT